MASEDWVTLVSGLQQVLFMVVFFVGLIYLISFLGKHLDRSEGKEEPKRRKLWKRLVALLLCAGLLSAYIAFFRYVERRPFFTYLPGTDNIWAERKESEMIGASTIGHTWNPFPRIGIRVLEANEKQVICEALYFPAGALRMRMWSTDVGVEYYHPDVERYSMSPIFME